MSAPDKNLFSIWNKNPVGECYVGDLVATLENSDALKISLSSKGFVSAGTIVGGKEDCVDINNHCRDIQVQATLFVPQGDYAFTIKGGSEDITVTGVVRGHGKVVDVDLGNVSDQSDDLTRRVSICLTHENGEPITIRVLGCENPKLLNAGAQKYVYTFRLWKPFRGLFLKTYKQLKKILPI